MDNKVAAPGADLGQITTEILLLKQQTASNIVEIGRRLIKAKEVVGHGNWLRYLEESVDIKERTAQQFMRAARECVSNPQTFADLDQSKVFLLLEAPAEAREELAEKAPDQTAEQLEAAVRATNAAIKEAERAKRDLVDMERRLEKAEQRAHEAESRPPKVVEKSVERQVIMPDPKQGQQIQELRRDLDQANHRYNELLAKAEGTAEAQRQLETAKQQVEAMQKRLQRIGLQFDDEGRDPNGGTKLLDALDPFFPSVPTLLGRLRSLKASGVGGPCDDDRVAALIPQLRDVADNLESILKDRSTRTINILPKEE